MRNLVSSAAFRFLSSVTLLSLLAGTSGAVAQVVGTAGAVNPASNSIPPGGGVRVVQIGASVVHKERIQTGAAGSVQLVFVDKTSISIGPNSDLTIDEFVYDPSAGTGRMAATMAKGVLRFVGGNTSHTGGATINTPAATLGIRGGTMTAAHNGQEGTQAILHYGRMGVAARQCRPVGSPSGGGRAELCNPSAPTTPVVVTRPDFGVRVTSGGEATPPARVPPAELAALSSQLTSRPGQTGGAPRQPTPQIVQAAGVGTTQAPLNPASTPSLQGQTTAASTTRTVGPAAAIQQQSTTAQVIQQGVQLQATQNTAEQVHTPPPEPPPPVEPPPVQPPPPPPPPPVGPPLRFYSMAMSIDPALGSGAPYLPSGFAAPGAFYNSPILGIGLAGSRTSRFLQAGLNINGTGASQTSTLYVAPGTAFVGSTGANVFNGAFVGTTRLAANGPAGRAFGVFSGAGSNVTFDTDSSPVQASVTTADINASDQIVPQPASYVLGGGTSEVTYTFNQTATRSATPTGLGTTRPSVPLSGFATGLMRTFNPATGPVAPSFVFEGVTTFALDNSTPNFGAVITGSNTTPSPTDNFNTATYLIGYQGTGSATGRATYVDYDNFGGREARAVNNGPFLSTVNGSQVSGNRSVFVTAQTVNAQSQFPTITTPCRCEFTRWGFWSTADERTAGSQTYRDILHLGTWVSGRPTPAVDMPVVGSATYSGHVIASIKSNGNEYVAGGNFANAVNFGSRTGSVAIAGLDGRNYSGSISYAPGSSTFGGILSGTGLGAPSMNVQGQFYDGPLGPAYEMGGTVRINGGASYIGAGTFAASR